MSASLRKLSEPQPFGTYVLLTAAHNEEDFIEGTIRSVLAQTLLPKRWVIVSDNSTDMTDAIVQNYAGQHDFIRLLHITRAPGRSFGSKVIALHQGQKLLQDVEYDFIANVDADVSFDPCYFEQLVSHFGRNQGLGLTGGFVYEKSAGEYRSLRLNDVRNVGHAAQMVKRECYQAIGGYPVLKYGGEDWYAQTKARMMGWQVESLPQLKICHQRPITGGSNALSNSFRQGRQDYSFCSHPLFEILKCLRRLQERPYVVHALVRFAGFLSAYIYGEPRAVPDDLARFLRREQMDRVSQLLNRPWTAVATAITRFNREKAA